jgi:protein PET100
MGGWKLEVVKMSLYITFPVVLLHYFNKPEYFEKWVVKTRRTVFPPDNKTHREEIEECIKNIREKKELEMLKHMQEQDGGSV